MRLASFYTGCLDTCHPERPLEIPLTSVGFHFQEAVASGSVNVITWLINNPGHVHSRRHCACSSCVLRKRSTFIVQIVQCSSKKKATKPAAVTEAKPDVPPALVSNVPPPAPAPQAAAAAKAPPTEDAPAAPKADRTPSMTSKSEPNKLDKTQTEPGTQTNEGTKGNTKDEADTFEEHKPQTREAKRGKEIAAKQPVKQRDDYKTFNKKNMPESDFDKTMSGVQGV
ncbi:hypothetical protein L596_010666 [Steinernema carpocapsae]|uniref:Uncharacterized protein n=1 Tax=Steinernema carpocapsae TaxID=34508 RepID=A0A4U5PJI9_STECR|nr:hypothetical protein L596_010666 [Steinernema carpocapsae]